MKKLFALLTAMMMALTLTACAEKKTEEQKQAESALEALGISEDEAEELANDLAEALGIDPDDYVADPNAGKDGTWGSAVSFYDGIANALDNLINGIVEANNEKLETDNPDGYWQDPAYMSLIYMPFLSTSLAMTTSVTDTAAPSTVAMVYEVWGEQDVTFTVNAPGDYTVTYKSPDWSDETIVDDVRIEMLFDKDSNSLRYVEYTNGTQSLFYEYVGLGNDVYAMQSRSDRALLTYKDGVITDVHHSMTIWEEDWETGELSDMSVRYDAEADSIWGRNDIGDDWVTERSGNLRYVFDYNGTSLVVTRMDDDYDWESDVTTWVQLDPVTMSAQ